MSEWLKEQPWKGCVRLVCTKGSNPFLSVFLCGASLSERVVCVPTGLTHAIVPVVVGKAITGRGLGRRFWVLAVFCSVLPDLDVVGFRFGVEYGDFFGHRGFFHSLFFAFVVSSVVSLLAFRKLGVFSKKWWVVWGFLFGVGASHGLLDAFTDGGLGIALFSPFDTTRYFMPWRPLRVSPIGVSVIFSSRARRVLLSEIVGIWIPLTVMLVFATALRRLGKQSNESPGDGVG